MGGTTLSVIILGIITGLITAAVLLVIKSLFVNSFIPWYRQIMFKGGDLSGTWYSVENTQKILLELNQSCAKLSGKATVQLLANIQDNKRRDELHLDDVRTFDVSGEVSERFISLIFKHTDKKRLGLVSLLLQVEGDGTKLSGQGCWYAPVMSKIASGNRVFHREEARAHQILKKKNEELKKKYNQDKS